MCLKHMYIERYLVLSTVYMLCELLLFRKVMNATCNKDGIYAPAGSVCMFCVLKLLIAFIACYNFDLVSYT